MKIKRRKKFHHLAIPRVLIAWAVALIITIILAIIIRRNADSDLYFQIEDITESTYNFLTKAEDEADYEKRSNSNKVYLASMTDFMEEAGDWPDGIFLMGTKSYAYVYNLDKDEIESDSSMMFFTFASPVEENGVMHSRIFICDKETMMQSEEFREICETFENRANDDAEWFKNRYVYYSLKAESLYINEDSMRFLPKTVTVHKEIHENKLGMYHSDIFHDKVISEDYPVDFPEYSKEELAGYINSIATDDWELAHPEVKAVTDQFYAMSYFGSTEKSKAYFMNMIEKNGMSHSQDGNPIFTRSSLNEGLYYEYVARFPENLGNRELHFLCAREDTNATFKPIYRRIGWILLSVATVIALLLSFIQYRKYAYFYRMEDYRKTLMNSMAHDLKTPLAVMSGYAENLKENVQSEKREHYAEEIYSHTQYMNGIIADVLELSRMEDSNVKLKKESVDFCALANEIAKEYEVMMQEKNLTLIVEGKYTNRVDKIMMKRALENLMTNAIKYTKEGGSIRITGSMIPFRSKFIFENTPIEPIKIRPSKLWEPFVKDDESRTGGNGTGVGLSIVNNILGVSGLKGKIKTEGDTFRVIIK